MNCYNCNCLYLKRINKQSSKQTPTYIKDKSKNIIKLICRETYFSQRMTKPTKWHMRPAKTQISLGIHPVWSESSLSAWRTLGSWATHSVHSEDWSDWADAQADLSHRWAHMPFCWFCHALAHLTNIKIFLLLTTLSENLFVEFPTPLI